MLVSVAIPAYNEVGYIDKLLRSLRAQTVPCEIVVCDNNSTDKTAQVAKRYADKVVHEPRRGMLLTSISGPVSNFLQAAIFALLFRATLPMSPPGAVQMFFIYGMMLSILR